MSRDMPAGYDPQLDKEFEPMPELDSQFGAPPALEESAGSEIDSQLFGDGGDDDYDPTNAAPKNAGRSIFEAALSAEASQQQKKKGGTIPAYARDLMKSMNLKEQDEDDDEPEEDDELGDTDIEFDMDDAGDTGDMEFDFGGDDVDDDDTDFDDEDEDSIDADIDDEDLAQTDEWKSEQDIDDEMARLLGDDSPYTQGATGGRGGGAKSGAYAFDKESSPTFMHAMSDKGSVDDSLVNAQKFESGGFMEEFDDGFVFVSSSGSTLAIVKPEDEDDGPLGYDDTDTSLRGLMVFRPEGSEDEDDEIIIELSGEELDALVAAIQGFKTTGSNSFMEHARRKANRAKRKRK